MDHPDAESHRWCAPGCFPAWFRALELHTSRVTAADTEDRLRRGLHRVTSGLDEQMPLPLLVSAIRQGQGLPVGQKLLIVLDQFEQWLHFQPDYAKSQLLQALRHCDGGRVQCVVLIRDDFWLAVTRFFRDLEVELRQDFNSFAVNFFRPEHARDVLIEFGRSFGRLPDIPSQAKSNCDQFLKAAIADLTEDGWIAPVRLSLFVEMIKEKEWNLATLDAVGGAEGVGLKFLEETFSPIACPTGKPRPPDGDRAVLSALVPSEGNDLKGRNALARAELLADSGYFRREHEFDAVLRILDDLKLITPTDPAGIQFDHAKLPTRDDTADRYYQLTHDYLVPALRDWLNRKRRESVRGRAQLLLEGREREWNRAPKESKSRFLPSLLESTKIAAFTRHRDRNSAQRRMLQSAWTLHARRSLLTIAVFVCTAMIVFLVLPKNPYAALNRLRDRLAPAGDRVEALKTLDFADEFVRGKVLDLLNDEDVASVFSEALDRVQHVIDREPRTRAQILELLNAKLKSRNTSTDIRLTAFERMQRIVPPQEVLSSLRGVPVLSGDSNSAEWSARVGQFIALIPLDRLQDDDRRQTIHIMLDILDSPPEGGLAEYCASRLDVASPTQMVEWLVDLSRRGGAVLLSPDENDRAYVEFHSRQRSARIVEMGFGSPKTVLAALPCRG